MHPIIGRPWYEATLGISASTLTRVALVAGIAVCAWAVASSIGWFRTNDNLGELQRNYARLEGELDTALSGLVEAKRTSKQADAAARRSAEEAARLRSEARSGREHSEDQLAELEALRADNRELGAIVASGAGIADALSEGTRRRYSELAAGENHLWDLQRLAGELEMQCAVVAGSG